MSIGNRHDATGRSTGRIRYFGSGKRHKFEEGFVAEPRSLLESPGYGALSFPAHKVLHFLKLEHVRHGGKENGLLLAPHRQLQTVARISPKNIKTALEMLQAFGLVRLTSSGERLGGRPNAATYALTWLPTCDGLMPTEDYKKVSAERVEAILQDLAATPARNRVASRPTPATLKQAKPTLGKAA